MASIIGHGVFGYALARAAKSHETPKALPLIAAVLACLPDVDSLGFYMGIPYDSLFGHRGFTHSLAFAIVSAGVAFAFLRTRNFRVLLILILAALSHPLFDAMTDGGQGVAFFSPFTNDRFFLPWRVIRVSPLHISKFFGMKGWTILENEAIWIGIPSIILIISAQIRDKAWSTILKT